MQSQRKTKASDPLVLEFQTVVSHLMRVLGSELGSFARAERMLNYRSHLSRDSNYFLRSEEVAQKVEEVSIVKGFLFLRKLQLSLFALFLFVFPSLFLKFLRFLA